MTGQFTTAQTKKRTNGAHDELLAAKAALQAELYNLSNAIEERHKERHKALEARLESKLDAINMKLDVLLSTQEIAGQQARMLMRDK